MGGAKFKVVIEVTTRCNADCSFCPRSKIIRSGKRSIADLEDKTLEKVVKDLAEFRDLELVWLSGLGEPLLYPNLFDAVDLIRKKLSPTVELRVITNCLLLKGKLAEKIIDSGIDSLVCSLNLANEKLYEKFRRSPDFNTIKKNIIEFLLMKGNQKPAVLLRINEFDVNKPYLAEARSFWSRYLNRNDSFSLGGFSNWAGKIVRESFVSKPIPSPRRPCSFLWNFLTINLEGYVFPCCVALSENSESFLCLGNVREKSACELYNSEKLKTLRSLHRKGEYPFPCDLCDSW